MTCTPYKAIRKGMGKTMRNNLYIHKSIIDQLPQDVKQLVYNAMKYINIDYDIIKINNTSQAVTFISSLDWDTAHEPTVGDSVTVYNNGEIKQTRASTNNPLIYHHKWQFVADDYKGFDVEESKRRSELWMNHPKILELKAAPGENFNSRIGRRQYWSEKVCPYIDN